VLHAWDTATPGAGRWAVMPILRRQAANDAGVSGGAGEEDDVQLHCCRTTRRALSARTRQTYARDWALFTDWCATTGAQVLPADPDTVVGFLTDCPAAPGTLRVRVAAIDHHHAAAGFEKPGETAAVRATAGRPTRETHRVPADTAAAVNAALRALPSHGWTRGMFGRRDRCLLVLSQLAGVPYQHLARLTAGDVNLTDGTATIRSPAGEWTLCPADDALMCGVCAVVRWLEVVDVAVTRIATIEVARLLTTGPRSHRPGTACLPGPGGPGRRGAGDTVALADRSMGCAAVPRAAADPALVVPSGPGPADRGPRGAPGPARRPRPGHRTRGAGAGAGGEGVQP
jgi:hypothetical protein